MVPEAQKRILDNMVSAILLFDEDLCLRYINPAGESLFRASARHLVGQGFYALITDDSEMQQQLGNAIDEGHPFTRHEVNLSLGHDVEIVADFIAVPINEPGLPHEILVEIHPIDRLIRITREENQLAQQQATRKILRGLAHEVKNPLGGLRGAAQLLGRQLESEELREYTSVIIEEADRLQNLVDRIVGPTRMPDKKEVNIHRILERVRSLVVAEVGDSISIQRDYDTSIPEIQADSELLIQALLNVVRNASQVVADGGVITLRTRVDRKLTIGQQRRDLVARIEIIDNGPGIPEEMRDKIFFPMVTGRADGTGLGLSIAQSLIQQHDGIIDVESVPGRTVFTVFLPI